MELTRLPFTDLTNQAADIEAEQYLAIDSSSLELILPAGDYVNTPESYTSASTATSEGSIIDEQEKIMLGMAKERPKEQDIRGLASFTLKPYALASVIELRILMKTDLEAEIDQTDMVEDNGQCLFEKAHTQAKHVATTTSPGGLGRRKAFRVRPNQFI